VRTDSEEAGLSKLSEPRAKGLIDASRNFDWAEGLKRNFSVPPARVEAGGKAPGDDARSPLIRAKFGDKTCCERQSRLVFVD
jgi:hypothetical protein